MIWLKTSPNCFSSPSMRMGHSSVHSSDLRCFAMETWKLWVWKLAIPWFFSQEKYAPFHWENDEKPLQFEKKRFF